jgi:hypothetical protein
MFWPDFRVARSFRPVRNIGQLYTFISIPGTSSYNIFSLHPVLLELLDGLLELRFIWWVPNHDVSVL